MFGGVALEFSWLEWSCSLSCFDGAQLVNGASLRPYNFWVGRFCSGRKAPVPGAGNAIEQER